MVEVPAAGRDDRRSAPSILIFIAADIASFILFFAVFMSERVKQAAAFDASASRLDRGIGLTNTLVLVTSGWMVARAVAECRRGEAVRARHLVTGATLLGTVFVFLKVWEYGRKYAEGIGITTDAFFSFYFVLTGVHLFHLVVGLGVLVAMRRWLGITDDPVGTQAKVESAALYWHLVDLLWVFLFPMLYLQAA